LCLSDQLQALEPNITEYYIKTGSYLQAKALVRFSRYWAAREADSGGKSDLIKSKEGMGFFPWFVSDARYSKTSSGYH
jgi:hypothetical protein